MHRRTFILGTGMALAAAGATRALAAEQSAVFDSHAHLITPDRIKYPPHPLNGGIRDSDFDDPVPVERLIREMDANGVQRACAVQRAFVYGFDNSYILDSAARYPDRLSPIVVLDGTNPETPAALRAMAGQHRIGGIRLSAARPDQVDLGWLNSDAAMQTWRTAADLGLPVCVIFFRAHLSFGLPAIKRIAERFPALPIIIDHVGVHHASQFEVAWADKHGHSNEVFGAPDFGMSPLLRRLAALSNVYFKFTPINFEQLDSGHIRHGEFIAALVAQLGSEKIMWGSDFGQTPGAYAPKVDAARQSVAQLKPADQQQLLFGTAARLYPYLKG